MEKWLAKIPWLAAIVAVLAGMFQKWRDGREKSRLAKDNAKLKQAVIHEATRRKREGAARDLADDLNRSYDERLRARLAEIERIRNGAGSSGPSGVQGPPDSGNQRGG